MTSRRFGLAIAAGVLNSRISAPPENALPAPMSTIALTFVSAVARSRPAAIPWRSAWPSPFTGGLFRVMTATSPGTAYSAPLTSSPLRHDLQTDDAGDDQRDAP